MTLILLAFFPLMMTKQFPSTFRAKETSLIRREAQPKAASGRREAQAEAATGRRYNGAPIGNEILMCLRSSQKRKGEVSLQDPIGTDAEGNEITLIDVLGTDGSEVHDQVERRVSLQDVRRLVEGLRGRERTVIEMRYGLLDGRAYAQQEVAAKLGISRSYISRIEKKAMLALRTAFEHGKVP